MITKRLFTFGCSFTKWQWPTWADILSKNQSYDLYENWGEPGAGNLFIFNSIIECNLRHKFTKDDTICVMWSTTHRVDVYNNHKWNLQGGLAEQGEYWNDQRGYYIRDLALIYAVDQIMSSIGCNFEMMSMTNWHNHVLSSKGLKIIAGTTADTDCDDIIEFYSELLSKIHPSMHEVIYNHDWNSRPQYTNNDHHPGPELHLEYLIKIFGDDRISSDARMMINEWKTPGLNTPQNWTLPGAHTPIRF